VVDTSPVFPHERFAHAVSKKKRADPLAMAWIAISRRCGERSNQLDPRSRGCPLTLSCPASRGALTGPDKSPTNPYPSALAVLPTRGRGSKTMAEAPLRTTCWTMILGAGSGDTDDRTRFVEDYGPAIRDYLASRWRHETRGLELEDGVIRRTSCLCTAARCRRRSER
jgi:hypothetical protein